MHELQIDTHERVQALSAAGDEFAEAGRFQDALAKYGNAWELLPEPKTQWEAATWLLAAIGDANFLKGDFESGRQHFALAMHCPNAIGNPFLHLRLGQCSLEVNDEDVAADELTRAYMAEGHQIFENDDPKYFAFLKTKLDPPADGWPDERKKWKWKFW